MCFRGEKSDTQKKGRETVKERDYWIGSKDEDRVIRKNETKHL